MPQVILGLAHPNSIASVAEAGMAELLELMRSIATILIFALGLNFGVVVFGQGLDTASREFRTELSRLASVCDRVGLKEEAAVTRRWLPQRRTDQFTLYLPVPDAPVSTDSEAAKHWYRYFSNARRKYAESLFAAAQRTVKTDESAAFRLLWQVLREDPKHEGAKAALGNLPAVVGASPRVRSGTAALQDLGWQPRTYLTVRTPHFDVVSRGSREQTEALAGKLEKLFVLWTQVFYTCWAKESKLSGGLGQSNVPRLNWPHKDRFQVAMLADRKEYLDLLGASEASIGVSVGYYQPAKKLAIFYPGDQLDVTLIHELTHQFFAESSIDVAASAPGANRSYWLVEGIAMYMESLADHGSYWTLGGWESPRMQTARYRGVRDGYWVPLDRLRSSTLDAWKVDPQISLLYTHAAGVTHTLMDNRLSKSTRQPTIAALRQLYAGTSDASGLLQLIGDDDEQAKIAYQDALLVSDEDIIALADSTASPTELVLCGSKLQKESWQRLSKFAGVTWLDLAFSNVGNDVLANWFDNTKQLRRLSLEGLAITREVLSRVGKLPNLVELDLSDSSVTDADIEALHGHPTIEILWLTRTKVTDAALNTLQSLPRLKTVDATGTEASSATWANWQQ